MARLNLARMRSQQGVILWALLCALLATGICVTLADLGKLPNVESRRANDTGQRAIVDPKTGRVSLSSGHSEAENNFDVGTEPVVTPVVTPEEPPVAEPTPTPEAPAPSEPAASTEPTPAPPSPTSDLPALRTAPLPSASTPAPSPSDALVPAPAPEISEKFDGMVIPKRGANDAHASSIYARHFKRVEDQKLLTIVVLDAGLSDQSMQLLLSLPKEITFAFSPYTIDAAKSIATARSAGHEAWTVLPMMSDRYPQHDPGPFGLVSNLPQEELMRRLHQIMATTIGSVGVILPPDEVISNRREIFLPILTETLGRGFFVITTNPTQGLDQITRDRRMQSFLRRVDIALDASPDDAQIQSKFTALNEALKKQDQVLVSISARPQSIALLQRWLKENPPTAPVTLAPLSALWKKVEEEPKPVEEEKGGHGAKKEEKKEEKSSGGHH